MFNEIALSFVQIPHLSKTNIRKEISLMKKEGYKRYKNNSYLILFKFVDNDYVNLAIYGVMIAFIIACYII